MAKKKPNIEVVLKGIFDIINKNDKGLGILEYEQFLIPVGLRGSVILEPDLYITNFIELIKNPESEIENRDKFPEINFVNEIDITESDVIKTMVGFVTHPILNNEDIWINIVDTEEKQSDFYLGKVVDIKIKLSDNETKTLLINKTLLPPGLKKKDFNNIYYTVLLPEDVFIMKKVFTTEIPDCNLSLYNILKII